ncbi:MAG: type II secretion system protein GspK [Myxococcales bacterium]
MTDPKLTRKREKQQGFALLLSLIALMILAVLVTDLHETTGQGFAASMAARDQLRAEYLAKSGVNLTRMLIGQEKNLRSLVAPIFSALMKGRPPPQLPVWNFANVILEPFANFEGSKENAASVGFDMDLAEGLGKTGGTFEVQASAENTKMTVNDPRLQDVALGRANIAKAIYTLTQGSPPFPSPNLYDPIFSGFDEKGRMNTRLDVLANIIDWWDADEQRTNYDPVLQAVQSSGSEDADYYRGLIEPYNIKNAPYDTLEELRLVRGVGDDFWATFVEPDIDSPASRQITIYGGGRVNPNGARPDVMLAAVCSFVEIRDQPLCSDPTGMERGKFIALVDMANSMGFGIPWFSRASDFVNFVSGSGPLFEQLQPLLQTFGMPQMMFTPITIPAQPADLRRRMQRQFSTNANVLTIESTGRVGHARRTIRTVVTTDEKWTPPPPNAGKMPPLGIFSYYRID